MTTFLQDIETEGVTLLGAAHDAWMEAYADIAKLEQQVAKDTKAAILTVVKAAENGATVEQMETMVLNLLQDEVATILKGLTSGALQVLIVFAKAAL